ncbi:nitrilase-related carbon-nitrogen hydrolase [Alkalicoccus saliphilus]|uniref:Nitrilase n=1 Tax=Alkalicoccus saliphilus TaxID=200989 RepID=A0A2T4U9S1_9BACI|nr:nitrilase-related carbon-nitrogen hydrolase [Alkalicoccus saliphilus]PTL40143.1 nitrilase [Alkalicoccus saliphilus]
MFFAAAIQFHPQLEKVENNLQRLEEAVVQAASSGAKFIVTPELAVSGYMYDTRSCILPHTDTIPGTVTDRFHSVCLQWNVYIVLGMPEYDSETGLLYNSAALIGPEGFIGKYRKTHLWEAEAHWATPGNLGFPVYQTELGRIAINICMDAVYMESSRIPALNGADILAFPTNSSAQTISMLQGWATLNGMYIVSANRADEEKGFQMAGASAIWSPYGEKLVEAKTMIDGGYEEIIYGVIDPKHYVNPNRQRLLKRRPELYRDIMLHIGPWNSRKTAKPSEINLKSYTMPRIEGGGTFKQFYDHWEEKLNRQEKNSERIPALSVLPALSATGSVSNLKYEELIFVGQAFVAEWLPKYQLLAERMNTALIVSAPEYVESKVYLSAWIINAEGKIDAVHRSTHLHEGDGHWAEGSDLTVVSVPGIGRVAVLFEEEGYFPEVTTACGVKRADIIALLAGEDSDEEYAPLIDERFHLNKESGSTLKAVWENLAMTVQAYTVLAGWQKENGKSITAVYSVDPYYEKEISAVADEEGVASKRVITLRNDLWYNQQNWIVSRRVEQYYPLVMKNDIQTSMLPAHEESDMMA